MTFAELAAECLRKLGSKDAPEDYVIVAHVKDKGISENSRELSLQKSHRTLEIIPFNHKRNSSNKELNLEMMW